MKKMILFLMIFAQINLSLISKSEQIFKENYIEKYKKEIKKNPLLLENYVMLALHYQEKKQYKEAIEQINKAINIPQNKALSYDSKTNKIHWLTKKTIQIRPQLFFFLRIIKVEEYFYLKDYKKTIVECNETIKEYSNFIKNDYYQGELSSGKLYYILGKSYYYLKDFKNSLLNYQQSLKHYKNYDHTYNAVAYVYLKQGLKKQALETFEKNIKLNPRYANGYDSLGEYYLKEGNNELACNYYEKSCDLGKDSSCKKFEKIMKLNK